MPESNLVAIDIGTSKVATIIAKLSETDPEPRIMGFSSVSSRGVKKGQIVDIHLVGEVVEESVEKAERMAGIKINSAYVAVGGPHISSLNSHGVVAIAQPNVEIQQGDIERAIEAAKAISISSTREVIEVIPRDYVVDGQSGIKNPLGMSGVRLEVNTHIMTANLTNLKNIERTLSDLGISRESYVFSGLCSSLATVTDTEKELGVVLIDIGGGKTDICIYVEGALSYSCSIPMGARHITNDIAVGLRVSLDSAEKIKLHLYDALKPHHTSKDKMKQTDEINITNLNLVEGISTVSTKTVIDGIIRPRLEEIFERVFEEIEKSGYLTAVPAGLVLTGGGALTLGSIETAKRVVGLAARIGVPTSVTGLVDEVLYPQYATVVGLLLYAKDNLANRTTSSMKDFSQILRGVSFKGSFKKVTDLFKSFMP